MYDFNIALQESNKRFEDMLNQGFDTHILVAGNGFDLAHGYNTRYTDFVDYTRTLSEEEQKNSFIKHFQAKMDLQSDGINKKWIDCEDEIAQITDSFSVMTSKMDDSLIKFFPNNLFSPKELFVLRSFSSYVVPLGSNYMVTEKYKNSEGYEGYYDKESILNDLINDLEEVIHYLKSFIREATKDDVFSPFGEAIIDYVVNFNYTTTYRKYISDEKNVYNIHGNIGNDYNNMVLGIGDKSEENLDYIYFKKYFQRMQKATRRFDINEICDTLVNLGMGVCVKRNVAAHFFGHSMSKTDGDILSEIIKTVNCSFIYYHSRKDYEEKIVNLIDMLGKKIVLDFIDRGKIIMCHIDQFEENTKLRIKRTRNE